MLSHALRTRTRQHTYIFRLQLHRHFNHTLTSTSEEDTPTPTHDLLPKSFRRTAFIQTWEPFKNVADAWALLRAVERKHGKVVEAQFMKDYEMANKYQMHIYVVFLDQKSVESIPKLGYRFYIPAPVIEDRPGGPGLDDISHLLDSADNDESFEFPDIASLDPKKRLIGAQITRATSDFYTLPKMHLSVANSALAKHFLLWHGFHKLEPMEASEDIKQEHWFEKPYREQVRMRAALQWCSRVTGLANPAVHSKLTPHENDGKVSVSSSASASMNSPESSSPVLNSSSASASIDSPESSTPATLDIPISHELTSKSNPSRSVLTEFPQPPSQSPPELTQLPPNPIPPESTIPPPRQLTPEQKLTMQKQMAMAKQLMVRTKNDAKKKRKIKKEPEEEEEENREAQLDKLESPELQPQSKSIVASFWKFLGR